MKAYVERREGGYYVAGSRISLDSVLRPFKDGASPESILKSLPLIGSLEKVYGVITFYLANKEAVEAYADANLDQDIVAGVVRREPKIDFELPQRLIPEGMRDPQVLAIAASHGRILVTHDVRTMPRHFADPLPY